MKSSVIQKCLPLFLFLIFFPGSIAAQTSVSKVWVADNRDGTYRNPILHADYSDPDVVRVDDDFYLVASSFNAAPGLPILHSRDLVNWTNIGHALPRQPPFDVFSRPQHGNGVWAPAIRYHDGELYIFYPDPDYGIYLVKAKNPAGPWSEPLLVKAAKGWIDPCPFWDDDGKAYLVSAFARSRSGIKSILVVSRMNEDGTTGRQHSMAPSKNPGEMQSAVLALALMEKIMFLWENRSKRVRGDGLEQRSAFSQRARQLFRKWVTLIMTGSELNHYNNSSHARSR